MSKNKMIIDEIISKFENDSDIGLYCDVTYGKTAQVITAVAHLNDVAISKMPVIIVSDTFSRNEKRRLLFSENEAVINVTFGLIQNDSAKADEELSELKELIKLAVKKDPQLNGQAVYSTIIKSKRLRVIPPPIHFVELTMHVTYND